MYSFIAADESGQFENLTSGVLSYHIICFVRFHCETREAFEEEQKRICGFLRAKCEIEGARFPGALHGNEKNGIVIRKINDALPGFLKDSPNGSYEICATIGSSEERDETVEVKNVLLNENYASNRYDMMFPMALSNALIYSHPDRTEQDDIMLMIATRTLDLSIVENSDVNKANNQLIDQLETHGHERRRSEDRDKRFYVVADRASIRTLTQQTLKNYDKIQVQVKPQMINYRDINYDQAILLLTDIVCGYIYHAITTEHGAANLGEALYRVKRLEIVNSDKLHVFANHRANKIYTQAIKDLQDNKPFSALKAIYNINEGNVYTFYHEHWYIKVNQLLVSKADPKVFDSIASALLDASQTASNHFDDQMIIMNLETMLENGTKPSAEALYQYHFASQNIFNHTGQQKVAAFHAEEAQRLLVNNHGERFFSFEEILTQKMATCVGLIDKHDFQKAVELAEDIVETHRGYIMDMNKLLNKQLPQKKVSFARNLSQLGQAYAFNGQNNKVDAAFSEALEHADQTLYPDDYRRIVGYWIHHYLEDRNQAGYERLCKAYYIPDTDALATTIISENITDRIKGQLNTILSEKTGINCFSIHIFLKAWYIYYRHYVPKQQAKSLLKRILKCKAFYAGHPWEIITKYLVVLALYYGLEEQFKTALAFFQQANDMRIILASDILQEIKQDSEQQIALAKEGKFDDLDKHGRWNYSYC